MKINILKKKIYINYIYRNMGRRNRIKKQQKEKIEDINDFVRDNTDYSIQETEEKKSKFFGIFEKTKDKKIEDFSQKLEKQKKEEEERLRRLEEIKEQAKKDAEEKAKQLQKEQEEKQKVLEKQKQEAEEKLKEEAAKAEEEAKKIKKGTFASLLSNIKTLDNFKEDVIDESVIMKEIVETKVEKVKETVLNLKILEEGKIYTLKFNRNINYALLYLTNLDQNEKIEMKLRKHRYQDTANYFICNNKKIKVDRNNTIIKFEKKSEQVIITGKNNSIIVKLKNKNIDCIKIDSNIKKHEYEWI